MQPIWGINRGQSLQGNMLHAWPISLQCHCCVIHYLPTHKPLKLDNCRIMLVSKISPALPDSEPGFYWWSITMLPATPLRVLPEVWHVWSPAHSAAQRTCDWFSHQAQYLNLTLWISQCGIIFCSPALSLVPFCNSIGLDWILDLWLTQAPGTQWINLCYLSCF